MKHHLVEYILTRLGLPEALSGESDPDAPAVTPELADDIKTFIDEIPGGFFIYKATGDERLIYANQSLVRLFGCDDYEDLMRHIGGSFRGLVHPDDLDEVEKSIIDQINESMFQLDHVEYRIVRKDGSVRWVDDYGHFIRNTVLGEVFYVFVVDETDKVIAQQAEQARRMDVIGALSINYESIFYVDLDTDTVVPYRLNVRSGKHFDAACSSRKFSEFAEEFVNTWIHQDDRDAILTALSKEVLSQRLAAEPEFTRNFVCVYGDELLHKQMHVVGVGNSNSKIVIGLRNVDDELRIEMQKKHILEDALENARRADDVKNIFLANMSHEMRTPLNAILGYANIVKNAPSDVAAVTKAMSKIEEAAAQASDLTEKVLEYTEEAAGRTIVKETGTNILRIVQNVVDFTADMARRKKITIETDLSAVKTPDVYTDAGKLTEILEQLADNAVKYTAPGGKVKIAVTELGTLPNGFREYRFSVADNGMGIEQRSVENIFDPFMRAKDSTQSGVFGPGLGLTIVKRFTELLGGTVELSTEEGKGSEFTVTVGMRIKRKSAKKSNTGDILAEVKRRKILIVEDNEINREIETELLEEFGFSVDGAENGQIAIDMLCAAPEDYYAVVLMDIQMPVLDGRKATEIIRKLDNPNLSNIPIIAVSANALENDKRLSEKAGIDAHIAKPVDVKLLLDTIASVISERRLDKKK